MTRIITDTTSCLTRSFAEQHKIPVIPQIINFGNESYLEGVDIDTHAFMERLVISPELPKTAAPPVEEFIKVFEQLVPLGEPILCIHPSSDVSGTVRSALTAKEEFPDADIRVIDTRLVASPLGIVVEQAVRWLQEGYSADDIQKRVQELSLRGRVYFLVSTLEYLQRGGRIGTAQAIIGSLLQVKPILVFQNGRVEPYEKARTQHRAFLRLKEIVLEQIPRDRDAFLTILHGGAPETAAQLAEDFRSELNLERVKIYDMPPAIITHAGPGVLGAGFFA
jgi:DegV family protein with EDD domain